MTNLSFTNAQMGETLAWVEDNNASYEEGAAHFLTTYKEVWGPWLNEAARDKLSTLLQ
jgi:glycine betaine/proline transport system substrate-binding protein